MTPTALGRYIAGVVEYTSNSIYATLVDEVRAGGHVVKLDRNDDGGWGLQLVVRPSEERTGWRAVGVLFPQLDELDAQALHLLTWLRALAAAA